MFYQTTGSLVVLTSHKPDTSHATWKMTWAVAVMSSIKGADVLQQIICKIKIRRSPTRHDNIDFRPIKTRILAIVPLSAVTADKGSDSEENHVLARELLHGFSI